MYILICKTSWISFWELLPQYIMAAGVLFAFIAYRSSNRSNHLSVIEKCSDEYRKLARKIQTLQEQNPKGKAKNKLICDFLGLFHKQLFYIKYHYVPKDIKIEWIKSMYSIMIKERDADVGLVFEYENCKSFDRVMLFMEPVTTEDKNGPCFQKKQLKTEDLKKHFKKHYFRFWEKTFLNKNKKWNNAFELEKIQP